MLGNAHVVFCVAALFFGAIVFWRPKGGDRHRIIGYLYVFSLFSLNLSALFVYEDTDSAGPFHILAVISLATLTCGFVPVFSRRPKSSWLTLHAYFMSWSYVGLVAAGVGQLLTLSIREPAIFTVGLPSVVLVVVGGIIIHLRIPKTLSVDMSSSKNR